MRSILAFFLLLSITSHAQPWKNFVMSVRGDTINRLDMQSRKQGPWVNRYEELRGEPGFEEQGYFVNDKKDGLWLKFTLMGDKIAEENYRWGNLNGKSRYFNNTGFLVREESWRAIDPSKDMDTVDVYDIKDPTKVIDRVVVKLEGQTNKHGLWTYYDPEWGTIQRTERYWLNKLKTGNGDGDDDEIKPIDVSKRSGLDSAGNKIKPQIVMDYEKKNSGKKKVKTRDGSTGM